MSPADADTAVKAVLEAVSGALAGGETLRLLGFGAFAAKERAARAGNEIAVPASRTVSFRAGAGLRDAVNPGRG